MEKDSTFDQLLSKQALHELVTLYGRAADRGDAGLFASAYHPDATVVSGSYTGPASEFVDLAIGWVRAKVRTYHQFSNELFAVRGDEAIGECYCLCVATQLIDGVPMDNLSGGRYLDRFERRNGIWKFSHRTFVLDWVIEQPSNSKKYPGPRGDWAPHDPVYQHWAAFSNMDGEGNE
ncbi:SnoaL-like protein [Paraburkholderia sp. BL27I4N3]|uniref:nuclear transport factor 2 family protein n=1 Tax=Paraburkholderia sp. BL27I4N3 TaxID=1938805 RepID=UPI000E232211|nr:nuclear transport factor 2 family protein [Paraburkholderia sp. BL27I4N3]REE07523.1 SnoaL-like protein [Paraburkholderia sp. BL27I4N3]